MRGDGLYLKKKEEEIAKRGGLFTDGEAGGAGKPAPAATSPPRVFFGERDLFFKIA